MYISTTTPSLSLYIYTSTYVCLSLYIPILILLFHPLSLSPFPSLYLLSSALLWTPSFAQHALPYPFLLLFRSQLIHLLLQDVKLNAPQNYMM